MVAGLDLSDVVRVDVIISPLAVPTRNFGVPLFVGSSEVIDIVERRRQYSNLTQVGEDFSVSDPEYIAAQAFFGQNPTPAICYIGRWAQNATPAIMYSGVLTGAQQLISNFSAVTDGSLFIWLNGIPRTVSGLNFSAQTTLNGVANVMQTALQAKVANTLFVWNSASDRFKLTNGVTGASSTMSWATPPTAWAGVAFSGQMAADDSLVIAGTTVTFKAATPGANEVLIGSDLAETLENLQIMLSTSEDVNLVKCNYTIFGSTLYIVSNVTGVTGDDITLAEGTDSLSRMTLSNVVSGKLSGGAGTDVSGLFRLSSATSAPAPVQGMTSETPAEAADIHLDGSHAWYGLQFVTVVQPTLSQHVAVAQMIEGAHPSRTYWYTSGESTILDPLTDADIASSMKVLNLARTTGLFSTTSYVAVASVFGRWANVDFRQNNSMITTKFKRLPGIVAETLTETQAQTVEDKHINVFVNYDVDVSIIQEGVMANGDFIDERFGCDWFQNALQIALFNVLYTSPTKVPQTDAGMHMLEIACKEVCEAAVFNGFAAPGRWTGPSFGQLVYNDVLTTGYYIYIPPVASQSQADREARKSVPIQIALKLAGAVHSVICTVWVNR